MTVVSFPSTTPPARFDNNPWTQVRIQESAFATGPWTTIQTKTLSPVDTNPAYPLERALTTELATLVEGWYRLIFVDATADESQPTSSIKNTISVLSEIRPSVARLSSIMRARTEGPFSNQGVFNAQTSPTADQADDLIDDAVDLVLIKLGPNIPSSLTRQASRAVTFKAAALIELTYYPEQANDDNSAYSLYQAQYDETMAALITSMNSDTPGGSGTRIISVPMVGSTGFIPYGRRYGVDLENLLP
jgi:hypothetical protein